MSQPYDEGTVPPWGSPESAGSSPDARGGTPTLACPVCRGTSFREEEGRLSTRWGMASHILTMRVCERCANVLFFYQGSGMAG